MKRHLKENNSNSCSFIQGAFCAFILSFFIFGFSVNSFTQSYQSNDDLKITQQHTNNVAYFFSSIIETEENELENTSPALFSGVSHLFSANNLIGRNVYSYPVFTILSSKLSLYLLYHNLKIPFLT